MTSQTKCAINFSTEFGTLPGLPDWRERWYERAANEKVSFPQFMAETYARQMETLGFLPVAFHQMKQVRSDINNLPLYHLALFSRKRLAYKYWDEVLKYSTPQRAFDFLGGLRGESCGGNVRH